MFFYKIKKKRVKNNSRLDLQTTLLIGKAQKWWGKGLQPNMKEVTSAQDLVDSLLKAGDKLVVVDFFSPGCGGCKALHPKVSIILFFWFLPYICAIYFMFFEL